MATILDHEVKMMLFDQNNVRFRIPVVNLAEKVPSYMILGALVKKLIFFKMAALVAILDLGLK